MNCQSAKESLPTPKLDTEFARLCFLYLFHNTAVICYQIEYKTGIHFYFLLDVGWIVPARFVKFVLSQKLTTIVVIYKFSSGCHFRFTILIHSSVCLFWNKYHIDFTEVSLFYCLPPDKTNFPLLSFSFYTFLTTI